ncbi:Na+/melibiose symporter-like transporter [Caulobacter ginsengisoli]|uniref:Na+/melibiose symporter-like transporter n=1 Tax=Caulobacter ginsengisoli TaxID=400775 RepID=A0ABU0INR9_9CAUL|nr:MFS transporter [Caulobacter ginsengisoli]MDQ0463642.1 Na+/melibiose symporter-like transporter [Caulobacter ginsengisoli]
MTTAPPSGAGRKLSAATIAAFAVSALPVGTLTTPLLVYLPNYYAGLMGISLTAVGAVFFLVKVLDIGFDPVMGMVMDRTTTRIGRYRFWLVVGAPILMLGVWMLFMAPPGVGQAYLFAWLAVLYVGYSLYVLSTVAWGAVLAPTYHLRSQVFAWAQVAGASGAVIVLTLPSILAGKAGGTGDIGVVQLMGWIVVISIPICAAITALGVREPIVPRPKGSTRVELKDFPALILRPSMARLLLVDICLTLGPGFTSPLFLFFFRQARGYTLTEANVLLLIYLIGSLLCAPLWALVSRRLGKHKTLIAAAGLYAIAQTLVVTIPHHSVGPMAIGMFLAGGIASAFAFMVRSMVADVGDEVRLETGKDQIGLIYALITSTAKIGTASTVMITYPLLQHLFGFNPAPGAVNTPEALHGLVLIYTILPVVMVALGGVVMLGYKLTGEKHAEIRAALDERDAQAALEAEKTALAAMSGEPLVT